MSKFEKKLIAVYGTLRRGQGNNSLLDNANFVSSALLKDKAVMFSNGGFPILSFNEELLADMSDLQPIVAEVFEVTDARTMERLDSLEGYPRWYNRTLRDFELADGSTVTAWIYHQDQDFRDRLEVVENGDWVQTNQARYRQWQRAAE